MRSCVTAIVDEQRLFDFLDVQILAMATGVRGHRMAEHGRERIGRCFRRSVGRRGVLLDASQDDLEQVANGRVLHVEQHERAVNELLDVLAAANLRCEIFQRDVLQRERERSSARPRSPPSSGTHLGLVVDELNMRAVL